jgi:hypothetical protein
MEEPPKVGQKKSFDYGYKMGHSKAVKTFKHLKIADKAKIVDWSEEGLSFRKIAAHIGRDKALINRIIQKANYLEKDDIPIRKVGSGRPRKVNGQMLLALRRQIRKYLTMTASDLKQTLPELAPMSDRSISTTCRSPSISPADPPPRSPS